MRGAPKRWWARRSTGTSPTAGRATRSTPRCRLGWSMGCCRVEGCVRSSRSSGTAGEERASAVAFWFLWVRAVGAALCVFMTCSNCTEWPTCCPGTFREDKRVCPCPWLMLPSASCDDGETKNEVGVFPLEPGPKALEHANDPLKLQLVPCSSWLPHTLPSHAPDITPSDDDVTHHPIT